MVQSIDTQKVLRFSPVVAKLKTIPFLIRSSMAGVTICFTDRYPNSLQDITLTNLALHIDDQPGLLDRLISDDQLCSDILRLLLRGYKIDNLFLWQENPCIKFVRNTGDLDSIYYLDIIPREKERK